jgi:hypothetical protein
VLWHGFGALPFPLARASCAPNYPCGRHFSRAASRRTSKPFFYLENKMEFSHNEVCYDQDGWMFIKEWFVTTAGKLVYFVSY